ncbi:hypothetical protein NODU109028_12500 [Nocardioides dubius]|uniref:Uncharacterized protein n=1 Tax=Nocardioides dubius TaxID=317019 RepID=A0ABP4EMZ2_9ACTN
MRDTLNPASGPVLALAALIVSPALWHGMVGGDLPLDVALSRYLLAVVGCWLALEVFVQFLPAPATARERADGDATVIDDTSVLPQIPAETAEYATDPYAS